MPDLDGEMESQPLIIGIDEVGRGCLVGPLVVASACNPLGWHHEQVKDSKQVKSEKKRGKLAAQIVEKVMWNLSSVEASIVNQLGISGALHSAYIACLEDMIKRVVVVRDRVWHSRQIQVILDGVMMEGVRQHFEPWGVEVIAMVGADAKIFESSCASLIAKNSRDTWCHEIVKTQPEMSLYHVETNKGYDSPNHTNALIQFGLTDQHRVVFCKTRIQNEAHKRRTCLTLKLANGKTIKFSPFSKKSALPAAPCAGDLFNDGQQMKSPLNTES